MRSIAIMALCFAASMSMGCRFGKSAADLPFARQPVGATMNITTVSGAYSGELLEARDDGMTILHQRTGLIFIPYSATRTFKAVDLGSRYASAGGVPSSQTIQRLRAISHYPQGITADIQRQLLARAQQSEVLIAR